MKTQLKTTKPAETTGLELVRSFMDYCLKLDMLTLDKPTKLVRDSLEYALTVCDDCGGAMCDSHCPVSQYAENMNEWLKTNENPS